jgi:retron-type reverse transcriptase
MKTSKNLFGEICSFRNLLQAFYKARRGKRDKRYVGAFELNLEQEILGLKSELESGIYKPSPLHRFVVRDPKSRVIHAPAFRDRVVHHAVCNVLEPIFDKTFIFDSYASRKGKGTHAALERFDDFERKVSGNGRLVLHAMDNNMVVGWAFKADIRHYFPSIDHEILLKLLERKTSDRRVLSLLRLILESYSPRPDIGMPLGALTSQLFANVYLNPLDHFVKERLVAKFYLRYLDDFVVLDRSKESLEEMKVQIYDFLANRLKLELHPEKSSIFPLHRGVGLLGFRVFYHYRLLRKSNLANFERRLESQEREVLSGNLSKVDFEKSLAGWLAHASWADTYKLRKRIESRAQRVLSERTNISHGLAPAANDTHGIEWRGRHSIDRSPRFRGQISRKFLRIASTSENFSTERI